MSYFIGYTKLLIFAFYIVMCMLTSFGFFHSGDPLSVVVGIVTGLSVIYSPLIFGKILSRYMDELTSPI